MRPRRSTCASPTTRSAQSTATAANHNLYNANGMTTQAAAFACRAKLSPNRRPRRRSPTSRRRSTSLIAGRKSERPRVSTRSRMDTFQYITESQQPHGSLSSHQQLRNVNPTSCPLKGVTCRRVLESHRYRWRRRPSSDSCVATASRHRLAPSHARAPPRKPNPPAPNASRLPSAARRQGPPIGHRPRKAQRRAPLPNLGRLSRSILNSFMPQSAPVQQQAGVVPPPLRPACPDAAAIAQPAACAAGGRPRARPASGNVTRRLGDRSGQPQRHHQALRDHRDRPRDHVGQRRSREQSGADGLRRHQRLLQRPRQAVAVQRDVPHQRPLAVQDGQRPRRRCGQQVFGLAGVAPGHLQADRQQHRVRADRRRASSPPPVSPSARPST